MNTKTLLKLSALLFVVLFATVSAFAQGLSTVYVNVTDGSDTYTGANSTNSPAGTGPVATINKGLSLLADNGKLVISAGTYLGGNGASGNVDINTTTYSRLVTGLTIESSAFGGNNTVSLSAGQFIYNVSGGTLTFGATAGTETFSITTAGLVVGSTTNNSNIAISNTNFVTLASGSFIQMYGTSAFTSAAPKKGTNLNLWYVGSGSPTAGPESNYGTYGTGSIQVNKSSGTVTFPNAMTFTGWATATADNADNAIQILSGNAVFGGAITIGAAGSSSVTPTTGDIIVAGTSNATFNGPVTVLILGQTAQLAGDVGNIENQGSGNVTFAAAVQWNLQYNDATAAINFASGVGTDLIRNYVGGAIAFNAGVTLNAGTATSGATATVLSVFANNVGAGTLTLGTVTAAEAVPVSSSSVKKVVNLSVVNASTGTVNVAGAIRGALTNSAAASGTVNVTGATTVSGVLTNGATKTIALGAYTLTLNTAGANLTNGGTITASTGGVAVTHTSGTASFDGGTLSNVTISGSGGTTNVTGAINVTNITISNGTNTFSANVTASGATSISGGTNTLANAVITWSTMHFTQSGGTLTLGGAAGGTLKVLGDFNRTAGTFTAGSASTVFFNGSVAQTFNGGPLLTVVNLTFTNTVGTITLGQSVRASGAVTINANTNLALGTLNIILNAAAASMNTAGTYTASGGGGVVLGGSTTVASGGFTGNMTAGPTLTASGAGRYSYVTVDVGTGNTATVSGATLWTGVLTLASGDLDIIGGNFEPYGSAAKIVRNAEESPNGITLGGGTFNAGAVQYDLEYNGTLTTDRPTGTELNANVRNLSISVVSDLDADADDDITTGAAPAYLEFPSAGINLVNGGLSVAATSAARIATAGGGPQVFDMQAPGVTHAIAGILTTADANDYYKISGASVNLVGSATSADPALIGNIQISSATGCAITSVQGFTGTFDANAGSVVSLAMGSNTTTAATLAGQQIIVGAVTLAGSSFTLASHVEAQAGVAHSAGSVNFGTFDLDLTTAGNYNQTGGTYTTGGGYLVMSSGGTLTLLNTAAGALPNLHILAATTLTAPGMVSGILSIGDENAGIPALTLAGNALTFSGTAINLTDDGTGTGNAIIGGGNTDGTNDGDLVITGTAVTITAYGDFGIEELTYSPTGGAGTLTFASDDAATARMFIVNDIFTHTAGTLALGKNNISFTGTGAAGATRAYVRGATSASAATVTATTGAFSFDAGVQTFTPGTDFSVPNLVVNNTSLTNSTPTIAFNVTSSLDLTAGTLATNAATLVLADNVTITRRAVGAVLSTNPTFSVKVNVNYDVVAGNITTDRELPGSATALKDLTINNQDAGATDFVILAKAVTVNGTLYLVDGELDEATFDVTMADGSTINKGLGAFEIASTDAPTVTNYNLVYSFGGAITSTSREFQSGTGKSILSLQVLADANDNPTALTLHANRTVGNLVLGGGSSILLDNGAAVHTLTASGNVDLSGGTITSATATGSELALVGTAAQTITVPAAGYVLAKEVNLRLNNAAGFTLTGGNLSMAAAAGRASGNTIFFVNGVLATGSNSVILAQTTVGQGIDRSGVSGSNVSHIFGKVRHSIPGGAGNSGTYANGRFEFPVGTATLYRPMAVTFTSTYPAINPTSVDVSMVDASPAGRVGLPLDGGNGTRIGNYPAYYWLVATTPSSFSASQQFDVELQGTNLGYPFTSAGELRIVRRQDGNADINAWQLQGTAASYQANYINVGTGGDSTIFVRSSSSLGGLVNQGSRFAIGIPTRPPVFTTAPPTGTVNEGALTTIQYAADPQDVGEGITYALVNPPAGAVINAATGVMTWTPTYAQAGNYNLTVSASDGQFTVTTTTAITVVNVNRAPAFSPKTVATTKTDKDTVKVVLAATDADNDALTYSFLSITPASAAAPTVTGATLTWKPVFADAGQVFTILALASDGVTTGQGPTPGVDTVTITATINRSRARGDVDGNGSVQAADASVVLQHVAGITLITDAAALYAADASNNGAVSAYDAALILQAAAGLTTLPASTEVSLGKSSAVEAVGSLNWSAPEASNDPDVVKVRVNLANAANVYAVQLSSKVDANQLSINGVEAALPEGWEMKWNMVDNELRVVMAGTTPLTSGSVATIMVRLKNRESRLSFSTESMLNETVQPVGAVEIAAVPTVFALSQNYPNPFNPSTTIKYQIANDANVNLVIYNLQGQSIRTLVAKEQKAGYYSVVWDGRTEAGQTVSSGLYLYRVQAGSFVATHKMLMIK